MSALFCAAGAFCEASAAGLPAEWLALYQYEKPLLGGYRSEITSPGFFFSLQGRTDPHAELEAAVRAFSAPAEKPAACRFPARRRALERWLGRRFPDADCPELREWLSRLRPERAAMVFAGAYTGNPASILGHTYLRLFARSEGEAKAPANGSGEAGRAGADLLSYSVGFAARPDPRDTKALFMLKGLTGGYPGFYDLDPHYINVGRYTNAESRDLWEVDLLLTPEEVEYLALHLWELAFNAQSDYFFIDENCSYRLIRMLEVVRPEARLSERLSLVVLPAETVRLLISAGLADPRARFRASIKRRMQLKLDLLTPESRAGYVAARGSLAATRALSDATAVDALLDHWLFTNYRAQTRLSPERAELMEAAFARAAALESGSRFRLSDAAIQSRQHLAPPFSGHKPRWVTAELGAPAAGVLAYRSGVHPPWLSDPGYRDVAAIDYLGAELELRERARPLWNLHLLGIRSIENFVGADRLPSWSVDVSVGERCGLCVSQSPALAAGAGIGIAAAGLSESVYVLADLQGRVWERSGAQALLAPGAVLGTKWSRDRLTLFAESRLHWWKAWREWRNEARLSWSVDRDHAAIIRGESKELAGPGGFNEARVFVGGARFFD